MRTGNLPSWLPFPGMNQDWPLTAAVISIGSELTLSGDASGGDLGILDLNGPMIRGRLAELGFYVVHQAIVPDDRALLLAQLRYCASLGVDLVVTSAGRGSTLDDITDEAIGAVTGRPLVLQEGVNGILRQTVTQRQRAEGEEGQDEDTLQAAVIKQLSLPRGALAFDPPGIAPPYFLEAGPQFDLRRMCRQLVGRARPGPMGWLALPGPHWEATSAFATAVADPHVAAWLARGTPLVTRTRRYFGGNEVAVTQALLDAEQQGFGELARRAITCFQRGGAETNFKVRLSASEEAAYAAFAAIIDTHFPGKLFSAGPPIEEILEPFLHGKRLAIAGYGAAAAKLYQRLEGRTEVSASLFEGPQEVADFLGESDGGSGAVQARQLVDRGLARGVDIAIALVAGDQPYASAAAAGGARVERSVASPQAAIDDGTPGFKRTQVDHATFEALALLYELAS
jgi:molybdopterin biosynthesis enzyme MoaB